MQINELLNRVTPVQMINLALRGQICIREDGEVVTIKSLTSDGVVKQRCFIEVPIDHTRILRERFSLARCFEWEYDTDLKVDATFEAEGSRVSLEISRLEEFIFLHRRFPEKELSRLCHQPLSDEFFTCKGGIVTVRYDGVDIFEEKASIAEMDAALDRAKEGSQSWVEKRTLALEPTDLNQVEVGIKMLLGVVVG